MQDMNGLMKYSNLNGHIMKTALAFLLFFSLGVAKAQETPAGKLGFALGTYLRIEGSRVEGPKTGGRTLRVDTVNGKKLDASVEIGIDNVDSLPAGTRCILRGYETGQMIGTPPAVEQAAKEQGKEISRPQAMWQFFRYFVILSVVEPKELKKK